MNEHDLVRTIVRIFDKLSIPYFVTVTSSPSHAASRVYL
jgi:hypothetical protein